MGRKSDMQVGVETFGTGVTSALSQGLGIQVRNEQLSMQVTMLASSYEHVFNSQAGISSQPGAVSLILLR